MASKDSSTRFQGRKHQTKLLQVIDRSLCPFVGSGRIPQAVSPDRRDRRSTFLSEFFYRSPEFALFNSHIHSLHTMADRRSDSEDGARAKRQKMEGGDPKDNPYLAHMYEGTNGAEKNSALAKFKRHQTTAALAKKAEDGDINPFSGQPFSSKYFSILKTRRDLPVHQQR